MTPERLLILILVIVIAGLLVVIYRLRRIPAHLAGVG